MNRGSSIVLLQKTAYRLILDASRSLEDVFKFYEENRNEFLVCVVKRRSSRSVWAIHGQTTALNFIVTFLHGIWMQCVEK